MSRFLTELNTCDLDDRRYRLLSPLVYESDILKCAITIPAGFETDLASVPRVPLVYWFWGGRAHREAVLHDYLYRIDSQPTVCFEEANRAFLEAMECCGKSSSVAYPMYWGVCLGGWWSYHRLKVSDPIKLRMLARIGQEGQEGILPHLMGVLQGKAPLGARRSGKWPEVRSEWLQDHPACAVCGGSRDVEVHHIEPFHLRPDLELNPKNFISLCEADKGGLNCHLAIGHLGSYRSWNKSVWLDALKWNLRLKGRP